MGLRRSCRLPARRWHQTVAFAMASLIMIISPTAVTEAACSSMTLALHTVLCGAQSAASLLVRRPLQLEDGMDRVAVKPVWDFLQDLVMDAIGKH